ncbi:hypothetical protein LG326_16905 (plasmid) [Metaplanococcus flavidus]
MGWFLNLSMPAQVAIITGTITLINIAVTVYLGKRGERISKENLEKTTVTTLEVNQKNNMILEKRRYIDAISMQRIEWINNIRNSFVDFNEWTAKRKLLHLGSKKVKEEVIDENTAKLFTIKKNIELYLNPEEFFSERLSFYLDEMIHIFSDFTTIQDNLLYRDIGNKIHFIEQVILKAEWRRIKEETEKGEQISKRDMEKIFEDVANEIDQNMYSKIKVEVINDVQDVNFA